MAVRAARRVQAVVAVNALEKARARHEPRVAVAVGVDAIVVDLTAVVIVRSRPKSLRLKLVKMPAVRHRVRAAVSASGLDAAHDRTGELTRRL